MLDKQQWQNVWSEKSYSNILSPNTSTCYNDYGAFGKSAYWAILAYFDVNRR